jgi:hypothetical protein
MKRALTLSILFAFGSMAMGQNPLVGTWELVSIKETDTAGVKSSLDQTSVREMKIITPTHYMFISHRVAGDSLVFDKAIAGTIKITGAKFVETPLHVSNKSDLKIKTDFAWKVQGDKFVQSGTITLPGGKQIKLEELVFKRVTTPSAYTKNPSNGTWEQLSSAFTFENGLKDYHTKQSTIRFQIINASHFMRINSKNGEFESAFGGPYTIEGGAMVPTFATASFTLNPADNAKSYMDQIVDGDILFIKGSTISGEGKETFKWEDVFRRVGK